MTHVLKVGDRLKVTEHGYEGIVDPVGTVLIVLAIDEVSFSTTATDSRVTKWHFVLDSYTDGLELVVSEPALSDIEPMTQTEQFLWRCIERGFFSDKTTAKEAINTMAYYPGAPWGKPGWDTEHLPYHDKVMAMNGGDK